MANPGVITVAAAIADPGLRDQAYGVLRGSHARAPLDLSEFAESRDLAAEVLRARPDILLLGLSDAAVFGDVVRTLRGSGSAPKVVAVSRSADPGMILQAMRAGATEYLFPPFGPEFTEALARLEGECNREPSAGRRAGQTIAFVSSKGGCGATSLACHAAAAYRRAGKETLLADLDFHSGVAAMCLEATPRYTLSDAVGSLERLDPTLWKALATQGADGVDVIAAAASPMDFGPHEDALRSLMRFWRSQYELTVVDLGHGVSTSLLGLAAEFDHIALVITEEAASLRMARQALQALHAAGKGDRVRLVLNRASKRAAIPAAELERLLECPLFETIPLDNAAGARNAAEFQAVRADSVMGQAVTRLAGKMAGLTLEGERRRFAFFGRGK